MNVKRFKSVAGEEAIRRSYDELLSAWPVRPDSVMVDTPFGQTHVLVTGPRDAPPLILFHGVGADAAEMWLYNIGELAARHRCYAVDTMGGPGRSLPGDGYGPGFSQIAWMEALWNGLRLERSSVAGVSYGSWLATEAALSLGGRVDKAVMLASGIGGRGGMLRMMRIMLPAMIVPAPKIVERAIAALAGPVPDAGGMLYRHVGLLFRHYRPQAMGCHRRRSFSDEELRGLAARSLWLLGANDALADVPASEQRFRSLGLRHHIVPDAWHALNHNQPALVDRMVLQFLATGTA